ncbi:hypothetical protein ACFWC5_34555 [Streptomyces sp. NPDC060085]|uniref:hypothetical protein n=1 Tax=Streptomyces sp. NPDC060085 TaxID=3347054 RepID=UPI00366284A4
MRSADRKPDRVGSIIAAIASVGSIYVAHLMMPKLSIGILVIPGIIIGAAIAIAIRKPRKPE